MHLLPFQTDHAARLLAALRRAGVALDASDPGCHAAGTPILLHDGRIVPVEQVRVGDHLMGWDSTPRTVRSLCRGREKMARIVPIKGEPFVVNLSHVLTLQYTRSSPRSGLFKLSDRIIDISVRDFLALNPTHRARLKLLRVGVDAWPERKLPLHPYHLGILLGDGCLLRGHLSLSKPGEVMAQAAAEIACCHGCRVRTHWRSLNNPTHYFQETGALWAALDSLGLGNARADGKFVPHAYKASSRWQRAEVLAGLLDTDGHRTNGCYDFISLSPRLSQDVAFLARSLGLAAYISPSWKQCQTGTGGIYWRVFISGDCTILPLRLAGKQATPRRQIKNVLRTGFSVELLPEEDFYGFSITGDGRFCLGDFTVTHNSGKTYVAAHTAKRAGWKLAVIAPKATLPAWRRVAAGFGAEVLFISNYEAVKLGKTQFGAFNRKEFIWQLPPDTLLVFDEAQRCKARDSQNARMLIAARRQGLRTLLCSATAAANPLEMRALGYALGLHRLQDFWRWAAVHGCRKGRFGFEFTGDREALDRLHHRVFGAGGPGARLRIADIPEFPETQIICEPVGTGREREIQAVYDQLKEDLNRALATDDTLRQEEIAREIDASAPNHLTILLRARQKIEALKADAIVSMAKDAAAEGMAVVVFLNFDDTVRDVAARLGTDCLIVGGQSDCARSDAIRNFQENREPFIVANIKAGGVGVSLHDPKGQKPRLALISPTYSAQDLRQCLGRVHRTGGAHSVQRILFAADTVEERACTAVSAKLACIDLLNDGDLSGPIFEISPHGVGVKENQPYEQHAKYSPSGLALKELCAGHTNREDSGPAAEEGTKIHKAIETGHLDGLDEEQRQCAEMCLRFVADEEAVFQPERVIKEHRLSICDGLTFGTADRIAINGNRALLTDFKFGRNSVPDAEINPQLQAYAVGVFEEFPVVEEVKAIILIPRRDEVSTAIYRRRDLDRLRLRISTIIARCEEPEPQLRPGDHCLYCARQATCAALHRHALTIAAGYEDELKLPDEFHPSRITDPSTMSRALVVARVMEKWCDSVKHHALQMRLGGQEIPGHELRTRAGTRKISDPLAAWAAVRDRMTPDQFIGCTDVSLPKLETAFAEGAPRGAKTKAKQELCEALADLGIVETGKESFYLAKTKK